MKMKTEYQLQLLRMISYYLKNHTEINKEGFKEEKDLVLEMQSEFKIY